MKQMLRVAIAGMLAGAAALAQATPSLPQTIAIQGKLERADQSAVTGTRAYRVRFFDAATSGSQLGGDATGNTALSPAGRFGIAVIPPPETTWAPELYYELAIDSAAVPDAAIDPADVFPDRVQVHSVPYALAAGNAVQLGGVVSGSYVTGDALTSLTTPLGGQTFWRLGGNLIDGLSNEFLGTLDKPLKLTSQGNPAALFEFAGTGMNITMGYLNSVEPPVDTGTISGGYFNFVREDFGAIAGGRNNAVDDGVPNTFDQAGFAAIGGGESNLAAAGHSVVSGGKDNLTSGTYSAVPGGAGNTAKGNYSLAAGRRSKALHDGSFVWGDATDADLETTADNQFLVRAGGGVGINTNESTEHVDLVTSESIRAGTDLQVKNGDNAMFVSATGRYNQAEGIQFDRALGSPGLLIEQGDNESAGIFMNGQTMVMWSPGDDDLLRFYDEDVFGADPLVPSMGLDGHGFLFLNRMFATNPIEVGTDSGNGNGAFLSGSGTWTNASDVNKKEGFAAIDKQALLAKLAAIPVSQWKYIGDATGALHMGPTAQDFMGAFGLGQDERFISTVDADGVALAAIQGLIEQNKAKEAELAALKQEKDAQIESLRSELDALKAAVAALAAKQ